MSDLIERLRTKKFLSIRNQLALQAEAADELTALRDRVAVLEGAISAAIECGMVPKSSAREGGAVRHTRAAQVADMLRDAILAKQEASHEG